jgi:hypothetical protein
MKLTLCILSLLGFLASIGTATAAELPDIVKTQAGQFEAAMKQYDASVAAQKKMALDQYVAFLTGARKVEEGAKRPAGVTAIDAELAAVKAGPIDGNAPADLPASLGTARDRFIAATKRAATSNDSVRKHTVDDYLKWLSGIQSAYAKAKDTATMSAIEEEKKRVLALAEAQAKR